MCCSLNRTECRLWWIPWSQYVAIYTSYIPCGGIHLLRGDWWQGLWSLVASFRLWHLGKWNFWCAFPLEVRHILQISGAPLCRQFFESLQQLLAGPVPGGIDMGRGLRYSLHLAHSYLGAWGGQSACTAAATFPSPSCDTVSRQRWTSPHLVLLPQGCTLDVTRLVAWQFGQCPWLASTVWWCQCSHGLWLSWTDLPLALWHFPF